MSTEWDGINDTTLMALVLWGESRGEPVEGKIACAWVMWNRHIKRKQTIRKVLLQPLQFSCLNKDDPNLDKIRKLRDNSDFYDAEYWECYWVAWGVINEYLQDNVKGADHYNTLGCDPKWDDNMTLVRTIGHHEFFRA